MKRKRTKSVIAMILTAVLCLATVCPAMGAETADELASAIEAAVEEDVEVTDVPEEAEESVEEDEPEQIVKDEGEATTGEAAEKADSVVESAEDGTKDGTEDGLEDRVEDSPEDDSETETAEPSIEEASIQEETEEPFETNDPKQADVNGEGAREENETEMVPLDDLTLPDAPNDGKEFWVFFREGYRDDRIEMSSFNLDADTKDQATVFWNRNLTIKGSSIDGNCNQYYLNEDNQWEQIGTYHLITDWATSVIASNLDVYDSSGSLIYDSPDSEVDDFHSGVIRINYNSLSGSHEFYYEDQFFYSDNNVYNNALAVLTLGMELASFSTNEDNYNDSIQEESDGYTIRAKNIRDTYNSIGFSDARYYYYGSPLSDSSDKAAYSFARKTITDGSSKDTLVVIPIRGGGYGAEWASNFRVGESGNSYGFNEAAKKVLADLKTYLQSIEIKGSLKLWITGFSRGAATANLLTHYINSEAGSGELGVPLSTENVYAYTFATPNCYYSAIGDFSGRDNNIFNIISANDMVPKMPLAHWGYQKYGQVRVLPTYTHKDVATEFEKITGRKLEISNLASLWNGVSDSLYIVVRDNGSYYHDYQEKVSGIFRDEFSNPGGSIASAFVKMLGTMLKKNPVYSLIAVGYTGGSYMQSEAEGLASMENMHHPEHYLSWLEFGHSEFGTTYSKMNANDRSTYNTILNATFENSYKRYRIYCPVDVRVYSSDGELLVSIIDNEIVEDQLPCSVYGEEKEFYLLGDTDSYHIELTGNDSGSMSYFVDEYNNESDVVRSVYYYDIPLEEGVVYQDDVTTEIEDEQEDYSVTNGETTVEKSFDTLTDSTETFSIEVENGGADKAFAAAGEAVMLYADPDEEQEFVRWESDDEDVVFDDETNPATFVKMPSKSIKVSAVFKEKGSDDPLIDLSGATVTIPPVTFNGKTQQAEVHVILNDKTLVENTDYAIENGNATDPGSYQVTITGIGSYTGTVTKTFLILPGKTTRGDMFNLANNVKVTWKEVPGAKYYKIYREGITDKNESREEPVIVTDRLIGWDKDPGLTNGHAYRYKIVASLTGKDAAGKSDPSGDSTLSYSKLMYRLKTVVIRSVKNTAPGKVTVKYDKSTSGDSYVLQYCERQDMVGAKTKVVLGANKTSYVIGGLKKGKTYYISIRVRKKVNGIDYYTTFGVAKKIKIVK